MAKKILAVVLGFVLAPAFITASHQSTTSIVGDTCLVRVYHTNFRFPPEGGRIVQLGNELFFWKNYLPECQNRLPHNTPVVVTPYMGVSDSGSSIHGALGSQLAGNPCAIRVYHSNFQLPPEGGKIVQMGNEMYFVKTYEPGCENVGAGSSVVQPHSSPIVPSQLNNQQTYQNTYTIAPSNTYYPNYNTPRSGTFQAPATGTVHGAYSTSCY